MAYDKVGLFKQFLSQVFWNGNSEKRFSMCDGPWDEGGTLLSLKGLLSFWVLAGVDGPELSFLGGHMDPEVSSPWCLYPFLLSNNGFENVVIKENGRPSIKGEKNGDSSVLAVAHGCPSNSHFIIFSVSSLGSLLQADNQRADWCVEVRHMGNHTTGIAIQFPDDSRSPVDTEGMFWAPWLQHYSFGWGSVSVNIK